MSGLGRLVFLFSLFVLSCGGEGPLIHVYLDGLEEAIKTVRLTGTVSVASTTAPSPLLQQTVTSSFGEVLVRLPLGADGPLKLRVDGLKRGNCVVAWGTTAADATVNTAVRDGVHVTLDHSEKGCNLTIVKSGGSGGRVVSRESVSSSPMTPAIDCGERCSEEFTLGADVHLSAQPDANAYFLGWSGPCTGSGVCSVAITDENLTVEARFQPVRQCTIDDLCWENPLPSGNILLGVWGAPTGELWAVGDRGTILRNDTGFWYPLPRETYANLRGIWGSSANDIWIISASTLVLHWNGVKLEHVTLPTPSNQMVVLWAVWGSGPQDVWIGGDAGMIWHWDGRLWSLVPTPVPNQVVRAIHGLPSGELWAVGSSGTVLQWNRDTKQFSIVPIPVANNLRAVYALSSESVWISGENGILLRKSGGGFNVQPSGTKDHLQAMWGSKPDDFWIFDVIGNALHWDGTRFNQVNSNTDRGLISAWGRGPDDIWVVGHGGAIIRWNGAYFTNMVGGVSANTMTVHGSSPDNVWFAGFPDVALRWDGNSLLPQAAPFGPVALQVFGPNDVSMITPNSIYQIEGNRWKQKCTSDYQLRGMFGRSSGLIWAVGDAGIVIQYLNGKCYSVQLTDQYGTLFNLRGVWTEPTGELWMIDDTGLVIYVDSTLKPFPRRAANVRLNAITGTDHNNIWMVGDGGTLQHFDGTTLTPITLQVANIHPDLFGVYVASPQEVWAVGDSGVIFKFTNGGVLDFLDSGISTKFTGIWGSGPKDIWVTGLFGAILHYTPK